MSDIKVLFMGTPEFAVPILEGLISNYSVVLVVTQPDRMVGRHKNVLFSPVKKVALEHHISVFQPEKIRDHCQEIFKYHPDLIITCAYGQILPKEILDFPRFGCINVHASLLPKLRGGAPIHKAIIDGYKETGITIMYMDTKMDSGDIIAQKSTDILDSDNLETLHDRLMIMGRDLLLETIPKIVEHRNDRIVQDERLVTYAYNITREEEHLDFSQSAYDLFNRIRGLSPSIGAYCLLDDQIFKIYSAYVLSDQSFHGKVGEIVHVSKEGIVVCTGKDYLVLTEVLPFGKKKMSVSSYLNGINRDNLVGKVLK